MVSGLETSPKDHSRICSGDAMPIWMESRLVSSNIPFHTLLLSLLDIIVIDVSQRIVKIAEIIVVKAVEAAQFIINIDDIVDYYGYWVSDAVKSTSPNVFCGWFKWEKGKGPWQRVLVVSNFSRKEVKANLVIDWKKLGVAPAKTFRDLWNDKDMTAEELKNATIKGAHFMMIGIK